MTEEAPDWLSELQALFSSALRTPLSRHTGKLDAEVSSYAPALLATLQPGPTLSAAEQMAVYNRQYFARLFSVLHGAFPLSSRILGFWQLNGVASEYLQQHPPRDVEIDRTADGFPAFAVEWLSTAELSSERALAFRQALRLDAAWRAVFSAPPVTPFRPTAADLERLPSCRLVRSPVFTVVEQSFPLLALRARALSETVEGAFELPAPFAAPEPWALVRSPQGMAQHRLAPLEARLLELVTTQTLGTALAGLENEASASEQGDLPRKTQEWLAKAMHAGAFCGIEPG
jgi:hypothetical protein